jgi:hypothetical protein
MNERYTESLKNAENKPDYDRKELMEEIKELVSDHGGEYSESLKVGADGRMLLSSRNRDKALALLPALTTTLNGDAPSIEDMYGILKDIADDLQGYEVSINEDRTTGSFEYHIRHKS